MFENQGDKEIKEYDFVLQVKDIKGNLLKKISFEENTPIPPGKIVKLIYKKDVNMFDKGDESLYDLASSKLRFTIDVTRVKFADGEELRVREE